MSIVLKDQKRSEPSPQRPGGSGLNVTAQTAARAFTERFGVAPRWLAAAPGRVNLIGEHTDYNGGFVLPMAIDRYAVVAAAPARNPARLSLHSLDLDSSVEIPLTGTVMPGVPSWANYVRGVVAGFERRGLTPPGLDALIVSEVPLGGGLSSSAALEVATATLLEATCGAALDAREKANLCRQAEHDFAGVPCGVMDQLASVLGDAAGALLIDCRSESVGLVPFATSEICVLICNTNVKHALADGAYARRRDECAKAARELDVPSLRDATPEMLDRARGRIDEVVWRRARHVVTENARTLAAAEGLRARDFAAVGRLMYESHGSLRDDFEVSCPELDTLVEIARELGTEGGVFGARMTGGGFGGCTVTLVSPDRVAPVTATLAGEYERRTGRATHPFAARPARGAHMVDPRSPAT
jgi:galactokinase